MSGSGLPSRDELYSRSKGILEVDILRDKIIAIIGLGCFGSHIAVEMAKAGIVEFRLFDFDRVELHNLSRHTATVHDLGRLKTDVIEESILGKNPYAKIYKYPIDVNRHIDTMSDIARRCDLIICATDNNRSRFLLAQICNEQDKMCIYGRANTRAEGGDVFIQRKGDACYCCLIGNQWFEADDEEIADVASARREGRVPAYVSPDEADAMVQVGLSSDILPICNMMVKLSLIELSKGRQSGIAELEEELTCNYYMWANRRERRFKNWSAFNNAARKPIILRWYGAHIKRNENCAVCSEQMHLDTGE